MESGPFDRARLYSLESAAEVLEVEPKTVRRLAQREGLAFYRLTPKSVRLAGSELAELVERSRRRAPDHRGAVSRRAS